MKKRNEIGPVFPELLSMEALSKSVVETAEKVRQLSGVKKDQKKLEQIMPVDFTALAYSEVKNIRTKLSELESESEGATETLTLISKCETPKIQYGVPTVKGIVEAVSEFSWGRSKNHDLIYLLNVSFKQFNARDYERRL